METEVIVYGFFGRDNETAIISADKYGLTVTNKNPQYKEDKYFIQSLIEQCVNMDEWKHGRYIDFDEAIKPDSEQYKKVLKILDDKINDREAEIKKLNDCKKVMECLTSPKG